MITNAETNTRVDEIAQGIYRISTPVIIPGGFSFNRYLVVDDEPLLFHTGPRGMFPLTRQVQIACDTAKGAVARLAGADIPKHEDTEQTFGDLKARIAKTVDFIESLKAERIDGTEDKEIVLAMRSGERRFKGMPYLLGFAYPNFYFHLTTAYNILRHNGVELGKLDFLGKT